jgi:urea ABC transporter permease protein UrtB
MDPIVLTQLMNVIYEITTLFMIVLGLAIVFGLLGVLNLAQGEFIMIGAYSAFFCQSQGWPYLTAVPLSLAVSVIMGCVVERVLIRPLYNRPFDTLLATWGLSLLLREIIDTSFGKGFKNLTLPISSSVETLGMEYPAYRLLLIGLSIVGIAILIVWYSKSHTGTRIKAMMGNPELAQAVGIRIDRLARNTFVVGTCVGGLAGVMIAPLVPVHPFMGLDYILQSFFVLVVGGMGSLLGLISGATIIGGIESIASAILSRTHGYLFVLIIAIFFLWLRPHGIFSRT